VRPTGELGFSCKPSFSGELCFKKLDYKTFDILIPRLGIGFIVFPPRLDTFPEVGVIVSKQSFTIVPGKTAPSKLNFFYLNPGLDLRLKINDSLNIYPGVDFNTGIIRGGYYTYVPGIDSGYYLIKKSYIGIGCRIGFEYIFRKNTAFFIEIKRSFNKMIHGSKMNYNEYGVGIRFKIKKEA
jgi:hypothetical protein